MLPAPTTLQPRAAFNPPRAYSGLWVSVLPAPSKVPPKNGLEKCAQRPCLGPEEPSTAAGGPRHGAASLWGQICPARGSGSAKCKLLGEVCPCPGESHVPTGVHPGTFQQHLRAGKLPAHGTQPPTALLPTSSSTPRKLQGDAETPATKPEKGWRRLPPAPRTHHPCPHRGTLETPRAHPTCRMRSILCPGKLLFPPGRCRAPSGKDGGGGDGFVSSPPPPQGDDPHTGVTSVNRAQLQPNSTTHTSSQTPLFPPSFTIGREDTKS